MRFNRILKILSFGGICVIIPIMAMATIFEKIYGTSYVHEHFYVALPMIILWGLITFFSIWYMLRVKLYKKIATFFLHLSLVVILVGALLTHLSGKQGKIHLRVGEDPVSEYITSDYELASFPFGVVLSDFRLQYYEGTFSPADFISDIKIVDGHEAYDASVSMNRIYSYGRYRFYQSGYDADLAGSYLSVSYDPYGIAVTYTGYIWLLLSIILFFFQKKTIFRSVLRSGVLKRSLTVLILFFTTGLGLNATPKTLPKEVADSFGDLYIYYNGRISPFNSFAIDFTMKIYGREKYNGLTPEQVLTGWLFFYDEWKKEPIIKIKGDNVKSLLGIEGEYAALSDYNNKLGYKLEQALREHGLNYDNVALANEKFNLISGLVTGALLKIYPYRPSDSEHLEWYGVNDHLQDAMPFDQWLFVKKSLDLISEKIALNDWDGVNELVAGIKKYQIKEGGDILPSRTRFKAEKFYNRSNYDKPLFIVSLSIGILLFFISILRLASNKSIPNWCMAISMSIMVLIFIYLTIRLGLRWYVSGHLPLSNGFETMQFMAWCSALLTIIVSPWFKMAPAFGFILCGFTLLVAMLGESSPQITNLMPVLQSPLLSIHVMVIMMAYILLAFTMLDGLSALLFSFYQESGDKLVYLRDISLLLLYPAVFFLAIGIFIGAVWANLSWGRYWGWDPKEVWALITLLIYSLPLHSTSLRWFRKPIFFHLYCIFAFMSVVITYFGVNFILGGMHSYA